MNSSLYTFVDTAYLRGRSVESVARQLCDGGADIIQLRAKAAGPDEIRRMAEAILPITRQAGVPLVINDYPDLARAVGAEFCHLGQEDFFEAGYSHVSQLWKRVAEPPKGGTPNGRGGGFVGRSAFRRLARFTSSNDSRPRTRGTPNAAAPLIGLSTHAPGQAERALRAEPAYIAIGPVFATGTKPAAKPVTLDYVRWAASHIAIPWFAIGGINLETLPAVLEAGAKRIAVVSAILNAPDIAEACREFKRWL
jgi:thiamine-phosphate pyrophosphorylase